MDSTSKMRPGLFTNRYVDFGHYEQCLDAVDEENKNNGQYSLIQIVWSQNSPRLHHGEPDTLDDYNFENLVSAICYPSNCLKSDVEQVIEKFRIDTGITIKLLTSETKETSYSSYSQPKIIASLILLSLFGMTHFSSTLCFYFGEENMPTLVRVFDSGSAWQKLTADTSNFGRRLDFFHGIRVLYLIGAICVHLHIPIRPILSAMYLPEVWYFDENPISATIIKLSVIPAATIFVIG